MIKEKLQEIVNDLAKFQNLCDIVRLIDPIQKISYSMEQDGNTVKKENCCSFWKRCRTCDKCIALKAYEQNDCYIKIEKMDDQLFLVTACPIACCDGSGVSVVEMIKNITQKGYIMNMGINAPLSIEAYFKEMNNRAVLDELTGLYNKRYINEILIADINKSVLFGSPICVIMADIDLFKNINDTYGHTVGDKLLRDFANLIRQSVRKGSDWVARYGGDEFLIVASGTGQEGGYRLAEKIRRKVEKKIFEYGKIKIKITASFGLYSINKLYLDVDTLIELVDKNLYEAKISGRNKVVGCHLDADAS